MWSESVKVLSNMMVIGLVLCLTISQVCNAATTANPDKDYNYLDHFDIDFPGHFIGFGVANGFAATKDLSMVAVGSIANNHISVHKVGGDWNVVVVYGGFGKNTTINALTFATDASLLAVASFEKDYIKLFDMKKEKLYKEFKREGHTVTAISEFFAGNTRIATSTADGLVTIWDVETGSIARELKFDDVGAIHSLAIDEDGTVLTFNLEEAKTVALFDLSWKDDTPYQNLSPNEECGHGRGMKISRNFMVIGCVDFSVRLYDIHQRKLIARFSHDLPGFSFAFSEKHLVSASFDATVRVWDLETLRGVDFMPWVAHRYPITGVAVSPDSKLVVTVNRDVLRQWRRTNKKSKTASDNEKSCDASSGQVCDAPQ